MLQLLRHQKISKQSGFTLIELMVVVSIIGLISAAVFTQLSSARVKAKNAKRVGDKRQVVGALNLYYSSTNGVWPSSGGTWVCLGPSSESCWQSPTYTGSNAVVTALQPYIQTLPRNDAYTGTFAYNRIIYNSNTTVAGQTGAFIVWAQEGTMSQSLCQGALPVQVLDARYSYCYEYLGR